MDTLRDKQQAGRALGRRGGAVEDVVNPVARQAGLSHRPYRLQGRLACTLAGPHRCANPRLCARPADEPNLFHLRHRSAACSKTSAATSGTREGLTASIVEFAPEVVFHLAAQPLVRRSYADPLGTYATNVMGTAHFWRPSVRLPVVRAVVCVTTDKCYENQEWVWPYRETDPLGGHDPYSSSKACAEIVAAAYRSSFFQSDRLKEHRVAAGHCPRGQRNRRRRLVGRPAHSRPDPRISGRQAGTHSPAESRPSLAACARAAARLHSAGREVA